jgi:hypothetical protein
MNVNPPGAPRGRRAGSIGVAKLADTIQAGLEESRLLMLGAQVLLGFHFRAVLERGFEGLPGGLQWVAVASLAALLVAAGLYVWPAAYHVIVDRGGDTPALHRFTTRVLCLGLLPFALGLAGDGAIVGYVAAGTPGAATGALAAGAGAMLAWYAYPAAQRREGREPMTGPHDGATLNDRITHALAEVRTILPGTQALLGFGTIAVLTEGFAALPPFLRTLHVASLAFIGVSTVVLMTPAAFHRVAERGESTERALRVMDRCVLIGMAALALGLAGDLWLVLEKVSGSRAAGAGGAAALLLVYFGAWFGWTSTVRLARERAGRAAATIG